MADVVVGPVADLWRYPVKSMQGEGLDQVSATSEVCSETERTRSLTKTAAKSAARKIRGGSRSSWTIVRSFGSRRHLIGSRPQCASTFQMVVDRFRAIRPT